MTRGEGIGAGGILVLGALILGAVVWIPERMWIREQAEEARARCLEAEDTEVCMSGIDEWSAECFRKSFRAQSRRQLSKPPITQQGQRLYDHCVRHGPDSVYELLRQDGEKRRAQERKQREQIDVHLPP
jgi:hypothetical protein